MKTFTLCCTLLGLVVLGTRADNFTRPGHRKDWPEIDRLGAFADTIDWFAKFEERVYLVTKDDRVYAFGNQTTGQMLFGLNIIEGLDVSEPKEIVELRNKKIIKFASSTGHMLALSADGTVWSWGRNSHAELGVGNKDNHPTPVPVERLFEVIDIVAANGFSLALTKTGQVIAWGYNGDNQCGLGETKVQQSPPARVHLSNLIARSLYTTYQGTSVVLTDQSQLYVWGFAATPSATLSLAPPKHVSVTTTNQYYYVVAEDGHIWRSVGGNQIKVEVYYQGTTKFKALHADPNADNFLLGEATDGKLWMWTDADRNKNPVMINTKDIVQAFAVNHSKGFLPFMVKLSN